MEEFAVNYAKQKIIEMCEEWMYADVAELFQETFGGFSLFGLA